MSDYNVWLEVEKLGPPPSDLAGYQLLHGRTVEVGDLYVREHGEIEWATLTVGLATDASGNLIARDGAATTARIYRRSLPPASNRPETPPTVHHSAERPEEKPDSVAEWAEKKGALLVGKALSYVEPAIAALMMPENSVQIAPPTCPLGEQSAADRKATPIATGFVDYFPDAMAEVARCSLAGNRQHMPGQPLHWDKSKSADEADALMRHFIDRGTRDTDGQRHSAKVAWRAMALLQREIEAEREGRS